MWLSDQRDIILCWRKSRWHLWTAAWRRKMMDAEKLIMILLPYRNRDGETEYLPSGCLLAVRYVKDMRWCPMGLGISTKRLVWRVHWRHCRTNESELVEDYRRLSGGWRVDGPLDLLKHSSHRIQDLNLAAQVLCRY